MLSQTDVAEAASSGPPPKEAPLSKWLPKPSSLSPPLRRHGALGASTLAVQLGNRATPAARGWPGLPAREAARSGAHLVERRGAGKARPKVARREQEAERLAQLALLQLALRGRCLLGAVGKPRAQGRHVRGHCHGGPVPWDERTGGCGAAPRQASRCQEPAVDTREAGRATQRCRSRDAWRARHSRSPAPPRPPPHPLQHSPDSRASEAPRLWATRQAETPPVERAMLRCAWLGLQEPWACRTRSAAVLVRPCPPLMPSTCAN